MNRILVIYFTQTGQAKKAIDAVLEPFVKNGDQIHYELIKPKTSFPYPWGYTEFFDAFPENVHGIPCELESFQIPHQDYDLIFISYQPWFLSICRPINSFLLSEEASVLLKNKPVVTVINCRNMWISAQEKMKKQMKRLNANLIGNITFVDKASNLVSLVTVLAHVLKGEKGKFLGIFPKYGVDEADINKGKVFGHIILDHFIKQDLNSIQPELNQQGALDIRGNLMMMEGRGNALFPLYANYISKKGTAGSEERRTRVRIFGIVLPTVILLISPILTIVSRLAPILAAKKFKKHIDYYSQNSLR